MAATFGAATRAPFASIVFVFELTGDYQVILPLMLATVLATLVAGGLMQDSIMTEKLTRRGLRVHADYEADLFRSTPVGQVMSTTVQTLPGAATVGEARERFAAGEHSAYPIVDDGRCVGIVTRGDVLRLPAGDDAPLLDHASRDVVTLTPDDLAITALHRLIEEQIEHLPVIDGGRLVGICTRTDLLHVRRRQIEQERTQPGFRAGSGRRPSRPTSEPLPPTG